MPEGRKLRRLSKADYDKTIREAKRLYLKEKLSIRQVAARLDAPYSTTHGWLVASGVQLERRRRPSQTTATQDGSKKAA
jgi:transposase-like protein